MLTLTRKYVFDVLSRQILPPLVWQHFTLCFSAVVFTDPNCAFSGSGLLFSLTPLLAADFYPFLLHEDKTAIKTKLMTIRYKQWNTWQCTRSVFPAGGGGGKNSITKGTAWQLQLIALFILKRIMCNFKPTDECMRSMQNYNLRLYVCRWCTSLLHFPTWCSLCSSSVEWRSQELERAWNTTSSPTSPDLVIQM